METIDVLSDPEMMKAAHAKIALIVFLSHNDHQYLKFVAPLRLKK